jgi:hypothetical protein
MTLKLITGPRALRAVLHHPLRGGNEPSDRLHCAASPFDTVNGAWSGSGRVTLKGGPTERLCCHASYHSSSGGDHLVCQFDARAPQTPSSCTETSTAAVVMSRVARKSAATELQATLLEEQPTIVCSVAIWWHRIRHPSRCQARAIPYQSPPDAPHCVESTSA